jgi:hypothetical protein
VLLADVCLLGSQASCGAVAGAGVQVVEIIASKDFMPRSLHDLFASVRM